MKVKDLLDIAGRGYPDGGLSDFYDDQGKPKEAPEGLGDGLARFIVVELFETFSESQSDEEQINVATRVLGIAHSEIEAAISALLEAEQRHN